MKEKYGFFIRFQFVIKRIKQNKKRQIEITLKLQKYSLKCKHIIIR